MKPRGYERGSILDLAILSGGSLDCAMSVCEKNDVHITDDMEIGREYDTDLLDNKNDYYKRIIDEDGVKPATALSIADMAACPYGGIGFMGIEIDFEVS